MVRDMPTVAALNHKLVAAERPHVEREERVLQAEEQYAHSHLRTTIAPRR